jgi:hypothetical protein
MFDPKEVTKLLDDIRSASNSLLNLVKPQAGNRLDVKARLEAVRTPVVKLLDIGCSGSMERKTGLRHRAGFAEASRTNQGTGSYVIDTPLTRASL